MARVSRHDTILLQLEECALSFMAVGTVLDWGWGKTFAQNFLSITLTYEKDTILYMSISVIYKIS